MKSIIITLSTIVVLSIATGCSNDCKENTNKPKHINTMENSVSENGFANVNGLKMYYEIHGAGSPLVLIHGGGSTIESSFGRIMPEFAKAHQVIAVELQAHGHTLDRDRPLSFEQDADDVAALLAQLQISNAD